MTYEFNDRMTAQRILLRVINKRAWPEEDLLGLSSKAIERWVAANRIDSKSPLVNLVSDASSKLFFLANKSQDQISEQYQMVKAELIELCGDIEHELDTLGQPVP